MKKLREFIGSSSDLATDAAAAGTQVSYQRPRETCGFFGVREAAEADRDSHEEGSFTDH